MEHMPKNIKLIYVDLFCGAGGTSTGVNLARYRDFECAKVVTCVNHDKNAIASHESNHPEALHFTEDIRSLELSPMIEHVEKMRATYPQAFVVLWASLECTNFSKAKGGQPRDADSRTLAEHLFRYIDALNPDYVQIENVEEFMSWGDIDDNGKPISMDKGKSFQKWVRAVKRYGYKFDFRILNAANYGAYTSRKRFFGIFAKPDLPIVFPEQTHAKKVETNLFGSLEKWKAVKDVLDFNDEGASIFTRKKELSDKTLERIYAGLIKFVAGGKDKWILKYNSMSKNGKHNPPGVDEPCPVVACQNRLGIVQASFLSKQFSGHPASKNIGVDGPTGTITTIDHHAFVSAYYGNGFNTSVESPAPTVTTRDRFSLVTPYLTPRESAIYGEICQTDSPIMVKIKEFMALYGVVDIKMRMLKIPELKQIMGFPKDYTLIGTQAEQKKYIGNAVEVTMARVMCEALCRELAQLDIKPINKAA